MAGVGVQARVAFGVLLAGLLALGAGMAAAAGRSEHEGAQEPVPTGEELAERCHDHREVLEFTRAQLRERERFVDAHCEDVGGKES